MTRPERGSLWIWRIDGEFEMIIYDSKYRWSGKKEDQKTPVSWWPGACWLKIVDRSRMMEKWNVVFAKPVLVITSETGEGYSVKSHYQDLAKAVCRDFFLDIKRVMWVEYYPDRPDQIDMVLFDPITRIGNEVQYSVRFRPVTEKEFEEIKIYIPKTKNLPRGEISNKS